jgi:2-polyprenyl-3-methyl-5-hydroxy-6-metoxy-1,4-benzoquinol methylase
MVSKEGNMEKKHTESTSCPLCRESSNFPFSYEEIMMEGQKEILGINKCVFCKCIYVSPRLNEEGLNHLYGKLYEQATLSGQNHISPDVSAGEYKSFYDYTMQLLPEGGHILDVGCGVGNYLELFQTNPKFTLEGVEYSSYAAQKAIDKEIKVHKGDLRELALGGNRYDLITVLYVLEHVREPVELLCEIARLLKPDGYVILSVPNYNYLKMVYTGLVSRIIFRKKTNLHPAEHLQNFTPKTIEYAIRKAGLVPLRWNLALPLSYGSLLFRTLKIFFHPIIKLLFICGIHVGGIHLIARKKT